MKAFYRDTWVEVNLDAIRANVEAFRRHLPAGTQLIAVVKADGYGHGAAEVGREALASGATALAVALVDEAVALRTQGITAPIFVMGYAPLEAVPLAIRHDIGLTVYHMEWLLQAKELIPPGQTLSVHVKVDTGMGRIGVRSLEELEQLAEMLTIQPSFRWDSIFTHFACADEEDADHVAEQHRLFQEWLEELRRKGYRVPKVHCNNSAAAQAYPQWGYDCVRLGISLYGYYPSPWLKRVASVPLVPALRLVSRLSHVKVVEPGATVSYGATYKATTREQIGTIPIGYADGLSRALSNRGYALHNGKRVSIVGRVCMDQTMVRIDEGTAKVGDEVVLYGRQGDEEITLDEVAEMLGTINYEVACMLGHRLPRVYLRGGRVVGVKNYLLPQETAIMQEFE